MDRQETIAVAVVVGFGVTLTFVAMLQPDLRLRFRTLARSRRNSSVKSFSLSAAPT